MTNSSLFRRISRDMEKYKAEELRTVPLDIPTSNNASNRTSGELALASQLPIPRLIIPWLLLTQTLSTLVEHLRRCNSHRS